METTTYSTQVKALASSNVTVSLGPGNRTDETLLPKPSMGRNSVDMPREKGRLMTPKKITTVGTWNVRTLYATGAVSMLIHELARLRWDVVGVAETHWTGIQESMVQGYKVISSGKAEGHRSGVGLILTANAQRSLISYKPVSDRVISARFHTATGAVTICQIYAPTIDAKDEDIDAFYNDLQQEIISSPRSDTLIIMGDFNAKVGVGDKDTSSIMGMCGSGQRNERGDRLLDFCSVNNLCITNTRFKQTKENRQWTWESPDGRTHNTIDYILVSRKLMSSVQSSRAFPSADCGSDHQLLMANIKLRLKAQKPMTRIKRVDVGRLKDDTVLQAYQVKLEERLEERWQEMSGKLTNDVEAMWERVKSSIQETSKEVLGFRKGQKQKEWLSPQTLKLMDQRREYRGRRKQHSDMAKHHNYLCRMVKKSAKEDKERYIREICRGVENARTQQRTRAVYEGIRKITGKHAPQVKSVKDELGTVITDPLAVKRRWKDYFDKLYNDPNEVQEEVLINLQDAGNSEDIPGIGEDEVKAAVQRMKHGKAPGIDNITAEELGVMIQGIGLQMLHRLCGLVWEKEELPTDWKHSVIVPIHKKNDRLDCSNYRGISLLCHCSKVFSSIILLRIRKRTDEILSEAQAGFRANRSTIDQIFTLRQLAEKYEEFGKELYVCYIDFRKAFDSVWRKGLWTVMRHYGYPEKIIRILENAYRDTFSAVRVDGDLTDWFNTVVGVLQGCVLSPLLFNIFLEAIMAMALDKTEVGALIGGEKLTDLRFADDIAMLAEEVGGLQSSLDSVVAVSKKMGMRINTAKTETQYLGKGNNRFCLQAEGQQLEQMDNFVYLGGSISTSEGSEGDVNRRIGLARGIIQSLSKIWSSNEISKGTKVLVYETLVLSVLLYNSETWTLKVTQQNRLRVFEMACLRRIEGVTKRDRVRNEVIRNRLGSRPDVISRIQQRRLRYFGHICRMGNGRYPLIAMNGYVHGQRGRGRPKKRWIDMINDDCEAMGTTLSEASRQALDRGGWRRSIVELPMHVSTLPRH